MNNAIERRKFTRLSVDFGPVVVFKKPRPLNLGSPKIVKFGPIVNISKGGVAVHYLGDGKRYNDFKTLSIMTLQDEIQSIDNIRFKVMSDVEVASVSESTTIRKRAMQFLRLTGFQTARIAYLIHSLAPANEVMDSVASTESTRPKREKIDIIRDIMGKFKTINAKVGDALPPLWLQDTYIPSLTSSEAKLVDQTIAQMVKLDLISFASEPIPHYKLNKKGLKFMDKL